MRSPGPNPRFPRLLLTMLLLGLALTGRGESSQRFCGGAVTPGDPTDLAHVVGDQTLEYAVSQPANIVTCSKGYLLEKCGDHESAMIIFNRCIAAGYVGAMIWKAQMIESGNGLGASLADAADLMHRAALSDDPAYAPIGKLHYATLLYEGRGIAQNRAEALTWFQAAAAAGNGEAETFLRTGHHTGARDLNGQGSGPMPDTPPAPPANPERVGADQADAPNGSREPSPSAANLASSGQFVANARAMKAGPGASPALAPLAAPTPLPPLAQVSAQVPLQSPLQSPPQAPAGIHLSAQPMLTQTDTFWTRNGAGGLIFLGVLAGYFWRRQKTISL